jgi:hypothetical protein
VSILMRYVPGLLAAAGGALLLFLSRRRFAITAAILATLLGLCCMEAEYWVAHGFPWSEVSFFASAVVLTVTALFLGVLGGAALGILGLGFFAYVNLRYGAPYLLDYVMPILYAIVLARSRRRLNWEGAGLRQAGWTEGLWIATTYSLSIWRTSSLDKWGWISGGPW